MGEGNENFKVTALGKDTPYHCMFNVVLKAGDKRGRVIIDGGAEINSSTKVFYALGVLALLILGLFPGTINTTGHGSALDFLAFLFLGAYVISDINKKLGEPQILIDRILNAIEAEFGF